MPTNVLLSIKPHFTQQIFAGTKRFEFRRTLFKERTIKTAIVYASSPVCQVIGEFDIAGILELEIVALWEQTHQFAGITKPSFDTYFREKHIGFAIHIGAIRQYTTPLSLATRFNIQRPPQSFQYISL